MPIWKRTLAGMASLVLITAMVTAQDSRKPGSVPDPQIAAAVHDVSPRRIQQTIERLVAFQTRQTLSSGMPASGGKGATAAAEWIKGQFEAYSSECDGCL